MTLVEGICLCFSSWIFGCIYLKELVLYISVAERKAKLLSFLGEDTTLLPALQTVASLTESDDRTSWHQKTLGIFTEAERSACVKPPPDNQPNLSSGYTMQHTRGCIITSI